MSKDLTIYIHKTFFVINFHNNKVKDTILSTLKNFKSYRYVYNKYIRRLVREEHKQYFSFNPFESTYRFTIGVLKDILLTLGSEGYTRENIEVVRVLNKNVRKLNLKFNYDKFTLRDYQQTYSNILSNQRDNKSIMLVDLQTGAGKSLIASHALVRINEVAFIMVLPRYVEKWVDDMYKYTNIDSKDLCIIKGGSSIKKLMDTPKKDLKYKVYIASITTMRNLISDYEYRTADRPYEYKFKPYELMDHLGVGVLLNDETHQHFHALLKISLYMNVNQIIGLSATLDSNDNEMKRLYTYMFPKDNRISNIANINSYVCVKAIEYRLFNPKKVRYILQGYNHNLFEQSIVRNSVLLGDYFEMVHHYFKESYINRKQDGERILIYMASVVMCTLFVNYLKIRYPNLDIRRYCEDDPYENVINAEVSVSTIISASTAIDIPKLITVINTISMASLQANLQTLGRLRKIEGRETWYYYLFASNISNQKQMHKIRRDTIKERVKLIVYDSYPKTIRTN